MGIINMMVVSYGVPDQRWYGVVAVNGIFFFPFPKQAGQFSDDLLLLHGRRKRNVLDRKPSVKYYIRSVEKFKYLYK